MKPFFATMCILSVLAMGIIGCSQKPPADADIIMPVKPENADRATPEDKSSVVKGSNKFALELFGRLEKQENVFFSPASISAALAMTFAGARGQTAEQMARTLHFTLDNQRLHPAFAALLWELQSANQRRACRLLIANALWGDRGTRFDSNFLQLTKKL
jgi:serpin B